MIVHALQHHGSHAFPHDIAIDFDGLPPLVATYGPNGAGKTTLFDLVAAALYLVMPYRPGALHRNFQMPGSITLVWSVEGRRYRSDVRVDPVAERTEASLSIVFEDGSARQVAGPLVKDYRRAVEGILGSLETFLAASYATQNGVGAFLRLARPERKALFGELLGLQVFPRYEAAAKARASAVGNELAIIRGRITDLEARVSARAQLQAKDVDLRTKVEHARAGIEAASEAGQTAYATLTEAKERRAALEPLRAEIAQLDRELADLARRLEDAQTRRANNETLRRRAGEIRAAAARALELQAQLEVLDGKLTAATATYQEALHAASTASLKRQVAQVQVRTTREHTQRLERQVEILATVPCRGEGEYAACQFLKDGAAASDALPVAQTEATSAADALAAMPEVATPADPTGTLQTEKRQLQAELQKLANARAEAGQLDVAEARIAELATLIEQTETDVRAKDARRAELRGQLAQLPVLDEAVLVAQRAVNDADQRRRAAEQNVVSLERELGRVETQLQAVLAAEVELDDLRQREAPVAGDVADWTLLTKAFGASGIPALLIDQALPELGWLATELLRECYGEQVFTIALTTQRENAAGDRMLETLDVIVSRGGEPLDAALLSGGESVLVSEALSLALALYTAGRSGRRIQTLLRDEVSAPLDVERAPAYVRMLRRAVVLGGFRHVLFVSHQPSCLELADARLRVAGGAVAVE